MKRVSRHYRGIIYLANIIMVLFLFNQGVSANLQVQGATGIGHDMLFPNSPPASEDYFLDTTTDTVLSGMVSNPGVGQGLASSSVNLATGTFNAITVGAPAIEFPIGEDTIILRRSGGFATAHFVETIHIAVLCLAP